MLNIALSLSLSIYIAGVLALFRFKKVSSNYKPFIYCIWCGCINELISIILIKSHLQSNINNNIYVLLEAILLLFLFRNLQSFNKAKWLFYLLMFSLVAIWLIENIFIGNITTVKLYFRVIYSFAVVLLSIEMINRIMLSGRKLFHNADFIICVGFIIYYTFKVLVHSFWLYGLGLSSDFLLHIYFTLVIINLVTNILYGFAVLWMPKKRGFVLPY
jgi:hypothetical protein